MPKKRTHLVAQIELVGLMPSAKATDISAATARRGNTASPSRARPACVIAAHIRHATPSPMLERLNVP